MNIQIDQLLVYCFFGVSILFSIGLLIKRFFCHKKISNNNNNNNRNNRTRWNTHLVNSISNQVAFEFSRPPTYTSELYKEESTNEKTTDYLPSYDSVLNTRKLSNI
jgi:hypothetical protein